MSQEILPLGNIASAATFPRVYGHSISTQLPDFLGNLEAIRKYCRMSTRGPSTELSQHKLTIYWHMYLQIDITLPIIEKTIFDEKVF